MYDVFRLEKQTTALKISSPLELSSSPSSTDSKHLRTSSAGTKQPPADVTVVSPVAVQHHIIRDPISPPFTNNIEHELPTNSPQHRELTQYPQQISDSHISPMYTSSPQQPAYSPGGDIGRMSRAVRGTSPNHMATGTDELPQRRILQPDSPPFTNNVGHQLPKHSRQHRHLPPYPQLISDSRVSPTYRSAPQHPVYSPHDVGQTSKAEGSTSAIQMMAGADKLQHRRIPQPDSPPYTSNVEHRLPTSSPQHRQLPQYPQQSSDSHTGLAYRSPPQRLTESPHNGVSRASQAVRGTSPNPRMTGTDEPGYSRVVQRTTPVKPFMPPVEQQVYVRPSLNQKYTPVSHQYTQPAGNHDRYRNNDPALVSRGVVPYHQQIPTVTGPRLGSSTSDVDGIHQKASNRSNSFKEQPPSAGYQVEHKIKPAVQTQRSSSQREMVAIRNEKDHYGERMFSFGNVPSPRRQNVQTNDPYRLHYSPVGRANHIQHGQIGAGPVWSRDQDHNMQNRLRTGGTGNANDNAAVRVAGIPALRTHSPAVTGPSQYPVSAYRGQQHNDLYQYPSPAQFVDQPVSFRPLPSAEQKPGDLRNPLTEPQYFRSRQVCMYISSVVSMMLLRLSCLLQQMLLLRVSHLTDAEILFLVSEMLVASPLICAL